MTLDRNIPAVTFLAPPSDEKPMDSTFAVRRGADESSYNPFAITRSAPHQDGNDTTGRRS